MSIAPVRLNLRMYQGSTFEEVLRWESGTKTYKDITSITKAAPVVVTAVGHGIAEDWRIIIANVVGMKEINSEDYIIASKLTVDTLEINAINSAGYTTYTSGGTIEYNAPMDLSGYTARMQLRTKVDSDTIIDTYESGTEITLDATNKSITILVSATATAAYTFNSAVYSLEMIHTSSGKVNQIATGVITLIKEVTR